MPSVPTSNLRTDTKCRFLDTVGGGAGTPAVVEISQGMGLLRRLEWGIIGPSGAVLDRGVDRSARVHEEAVTASLAIA